MFPAPGKIVKSSASVATLGNVETYVLVCTTLTWSRMVDAFVTTPSKPCPITLSIGMRHNSVGHTFGLKYTLF